MNINDTIDQIKENIEVFWGKLQENPHFNTLQEKFEVLPQRTQKIITFSCLGSILFGALLIPFSYFSASSEFVAEFEEKREITRQLLKTSTQDSFTSPKEMSYSVLGTKIQSKLKSLHLLESQIGKVSPGKSFESKYITKKVNQVNASISLNTLNLKQIINIGNSLQNIAIGIKMIGLNIEANKEDGHYFDVSYDFAHFSFPQEAEINERSKSKGPSKPKRKRR